MSWSKNTRAFLISKRKTAGHGAVTLLCALAMPNCFAENFPDTEESRIIITIDSAKYAHLTANRASGSKQTASSMRRKYIDRLERSFGLRHIESWPLTSLSETMLIFEAQAHERVAQLVDDIDRQRLFSSVQLVRRMRVAAKRTSRTPKAEPLASFQDNLKALGLGGSHSWATGKGVRIAVIDSGVDRRHSEFRGRIEESIDFTGGRRRDFDADIHGTVVASIIAGSRDGIGMLGIAPEAELIVLKACTERATRSRVAGCDSVALAKALDRAIELTPSVINLSIVGPEDPLLTRLVADAVRRNIPVVGVNSELADEVFPGSIAGVIAVAGDSHERQQSVSGQVLLAPNRAVLGAIPGGSYDYFSGESVATAAVTGVVALILQRKPHLTPVVIARLLHTTSHTDTGIVQACGSLARIVGVPCDSEQRY